MDPLRTLVWPLLLATVVAGCLGAPEKDGGGADQTPDPAASTHGSATATSTPTATPTPARQWWEDCRHPATAAWLDGALPTDLRGLEDTWEVPAQLGLGYDGPAPADAGEAGLVAILYYPTGNHGGWPAVHAAPAKGGGTDLTATAALADEATLRDWTKDFLQRAASLGAPERDALVDALERTDPGDGKVVLTAKSIDLPLRTDLAPGLRTDAGPATFVSDGQRLRETLGNWSLAWHVPALRHTFHDEVGAIEVQVTAWGHAEATAHGDDARLLARIDAAFEAAGIPSRDLATWPEGDVAVRRVQC